MGFKTVQPAPGQHATGELASALLHCGHLCNLLLNLVLCGHGIEDIVEELECSVELYLHPAGRLLDALSAVVRSPALDEAEPEDAEPPEVIHPHPLVL